jgi:hypothetical protein
VYVGDTVRGDLIALSAGSELPYRGTLPAADISADGRAAFDRTRVALSESVGYFSITPAAPGELTVTARAGDAKASQKITVKPSIPRPVVLFDFSNPPVTDAEAFGSEFKLVEDLTKRANRAVARVDLPAGGVTPHEKASLLLKVNNLPNDEKKLVKSNIRGVVCDVMTSPDFACDDPDVGITVIMQSSANWWMVLGDVPLKDVKEWKTQQIDVKLQDHFKAMPAALNIMFLLKSNKPVKGSIYFDHIGFMVR